MVIIRFMGGMGNQMFQYAYGLALEYCGRTVKYDCSWLKYYRKSLDIADVFNINFTDKLASETECRKLGYCNYSLWGRIQQHINVKKSFIYQSKPIEAIIYDKKLLTVDNKYMAGYFQSEKFFLPIKEQVKDTFRFRRGNKTNDEIIKCIENNNTIAIHVRRGDYVNNPIYDVCDEAYYKKAIILVKRKIEKPIFLIFSNDIPFCKRMFKNISAVYVDNNIGKESWQDMYLMSLCNGVIIPNSTFSWWGAWLNTKSKKTIVAPKKWFSSYNTETDIIPDEWWTV